MQTIDSTTPAGPEFPRWSEQLNDRSHVLVRPITRLDAGAERAFIEGLSLESRRFRFLGQVSHPSEATLARLTDIDYVHDVAFVAVIAEDAHERIVGVSRYGVDSSGLRCECAVVVDDDWHGRGLGTLLMRRLVDVARTRGIRSMFSIDSADNTHMTDLAGFFGFRTRIDPDDSRQVIHELAL